MHPPVSEVCAVLMIFMTRDNNSDLHSACPVGEEGYRGK